MFRVIFQSWHSFLHFDTNGTEFQNGSLWRPSESYAGHVLLAYCKRNSNVSIGYLLRLAVYIIDSGMRFRFVFFSSDHILSCPVAGPKSEVWPLVFPRMVVAFHLCHIMVTEKGLHYRFTSAFQSLLPLVSVGFPLQLSFLPLTVMWMESFLSSYVRPTVMPERRQKRETAGV